MSLTREKMLGRPVLPKRLHILIPVFALALCTLLPMPAYAAKTVAVANPEYEEALNRLAALSDEYDALASQMDQTLTQMEDVQSQITKNERQAEEVQKKIKDNSATLSTKQKALAAHISDNYKSGGVNLLSILFSSTSLEDAISKMYYHNIIVKAESDDIDDINAMKAELQAKQDELDQLKESLLEQEASINGLYEQQQLQADEMLDRQLQEAQLIETLPREVLETLDEDPDELINESQAVIAANEMNEQEEKQESTTSSKPDAQQTTSSTKTTDDSKSNDTGKKTDTSKSTDTSKNTTDTSTDTITPTITDNVIQKTDETPKVEDTTLDTEGPYAPGALQTLIDTAYATGPTRSDWGCSGWVYIVFKTAGISKFSGSAAQFYSKWCHSSDRSQLRAGMVIAVNNTGGSAAGRKYGHVGIYLGNGIVRHFTQGKVSDMDVDTWIKKYGKVCTVRWGWNGGIVLS